MQDSANSSSSLTASLRQSSLEAGAAILPSLPRTGGGSQSTGARLSDLPASAPAGTPLTPGWGNSIPSPLTPPIGGWASARRWPRTPFVISLRMAMTKQLFGPSRVTNAGSPSTRRWVGNAMAVFETTAVRSGSVARCPFFDCRFQSHPLGPSFWSTLTGCSIPLVLMALPKDSVPTTSFRRTTIPSI